MHLESTAGQVHESTVFENLMDAGQVHRAWGRPKLRPSIVVGDKGYSAGRIRLWGRQKHVITMIPRRTNERRTGCFSTSIYRQRNMVERAINRFKQFRRLATRYEKLSESYQIMWLIAAIFLAIL
jgi:transposase